MILIVQDYKLNLKEFLRFKKTILFIDKFG